MRNIDRLNYTIFKKRLINGLPLPHYVSVERVQDALVGQLQRVVQNFSILGRLDFSRIVLGHCVCYLPLGHLEQSFKVDEEVKNE
jgi:hypothetical protein